MSELLDKFLKDARAHKYWHFYSVRIDLIEFGVVELLFGNCPFKFTQVINQLLKKSKYQQILALSATNSRKYLINKILLAF